MKLNWKQLCSGHDLEGNLEIWDLTNWHTINWETCKILEFPSHVDRERVYRISTQPGTIDKTWEKLQKIIVPAGCIVDIYLPSDMKHVKIEYK